MAYSFRVFDHGHLVLLLWWKGVAEEAAILMKVRKQREEVERSQYPLKDMPPVI